MEAEEHMLFIERLGISAGGPAKRYQSLDPILGLVMETPTVVKVVPECCVSIIRQLGRHVGLLCMGSANITSWGLEDTQLGSITRSTTLLAALKGQGHLPAPRWGGIYLSDVAVFAADATGNVVSRTSIVYAASPIAPRSGAAEIERFQSEMHEKVVNLLRIFHLEGHSELVLGAWGCGRRGAPVSEVARIFREVLLESGDTANRFRHVVFALKNADDFDAFSREFPAARA